MSLLSAKDFPRWTRAKLGLPTDANLAEEIDRHIIAAEDYVRYAIGDEKFDELATVSEANALNRRRLATALHALVESRLHSVHAEQLGAQAGSSTQGGRSRTITADARRGAEASARRSHTDFTDGMFRLGLSVAPRALNEFYVEAKR